MGIHLFGEICNKSTFGRSYIICILNILERKKKYIKITKTVKCKTKLGFNVTSTACLAKIYLRYPKIIIYAEDFMCD